MSFPLCHVDFYSQSWLLKLHRITTLVFFQIQVQTSKLHRPRWLRKCESLPKLIFDQIRESSEWRFLCHSTESPLDDGHCTTSSRNAGPSATSQSPSNLAKQFGPLAEFTGCHTARNCIKVAQKIWRHFRCGDGCARLSTFLKCLNTSSPSGSRNLPKTRDKRISVNEIAQVSACVNDVRLCRANDSDSPQRPRCC